MKQGCFIQAYRDVLTACPEVRHHTTLAADRSELPVQYVLSSHNPVTDQCPNLGKSDYVGQQCTQHSKGFIYSA